MGGYGSGRSRDLWKKIPVEDCLVLSAGKLQRDRMLQEGLRASGSLTWTYSATGKKVSSIGYEVNTTDPTPWIRLHYTRTNTGDEVDYRVHLTTTPLPWGGVRWAFLCPGRTCGRTCRKLYLPPGSRYFACRKCYDLTYTSAQEAHRYDALFRRLGITPAQAKAMSV